MRHGGNYIFLLLFLLVILLLAISIHNLMMIRIIGLFMIFGICLFSYLITRRRRDQLILIPIGLIALLVYTLLHMSSEPDYLKVLDRLLWIGFSGYLILIIFREIFNAKNVNSQEIYGAISVYMIIGFLFAQIYELIIIFNSAAIAFDPKNFDGNLLQPGDLIYFSFVTLATVGYGDMTPSAPLSRAVCVIESITGIMYVAVLIARFVSIHSSKSEK